MDKFSENKNIGLAYCQSNGVNEKGEILNSWLLHTKDLDENLWDLDFCMSGKQFIKQFLLYRNPIPNVSAVIFKKDICIKAGSVNTAFTLNGDWDLYSRILLYSNIAYISKPLNNFRQHPKKGSTYNINNGNNIKECYWLANQWSISLQLTNLEKRKLLKHLYDGWNWQVGGGIVKLLSNNFLNIFPSAYKADRGILFKIILNR
jgi:hypothetical protein